MIFAKKEDVHCSNCDTPAPLRNVHPSGAKPPREWRGECQGCKLTVWFGLTETIVQAEPTGVGP